MRTAPTTAWSRGFLVGACSRAPEALEAPRRLSRLDAWARALGFSSALLGHLAGRAGRWRAVESHWLVPCGLAAAIVLPELPHRAHIHGGDLYLLERLPWAGSVARVLCCRRPELVFASTALERRFRNLAEASPEALGARCRVEAAPFDRSLFRPRSASERRQARAQLGLLGPTVLAAGRLQPIKGFDVLIAAVARLPPATRPTVIVAGEGPERANLARLARAARVGLSLPGGLGQQALASHMAAADLFVHPCRTLPSGRSEGMPLVVREALACGLRAVASTSGGLSDLRGTTGLTLVEAADADALAAAIASALVKTG
jgi:teichuronic acid biosynthesis glycosyltransferase TuaC